MVGTRATGLGEALNRVEPASSRRGCWKVPSRMPLFPPPRFGRRHGEVEKSARLLRDPISRHRSRGMVLEVGREEVRGVSDRLRPTVFPQTRGSGEVAKVAPSSILGRPSSWTILGVLDRRFFWRELRRGQAVENYREAHRSSSCRPGVLAAPVPPLSRTRLERGSGGPRDHGI